MRIQQSFTFFLLFTLIYSLQLQANRIGYENIEEPISFTPVKLSSVNIEIVKIGDRGDCPPDKEYCVGIIKYEDGSIYNGEISYGLPNGKGMMKWSDGSYYIGTFVKGQRNGYGEFQFTNGSRYEGTWSNNQMNGHGVFIWQNGAEYFGDFQNNKMHGRGSVVLNNNEGYSGDWSNNLPEGEGSFTQNNGSTYIGSVKEGLRDGEGKIIWENGDTIVGNWAAGKFDGDVKFLFQNGDQLLTEWADGQITYQSSYISANGKITIGKLEDIERELLFDNFENDFASNIQFTYYSIGLEYDTNFQFDQASEYFQMASNIENDDSELEESIKRSRYDLKKKRNSGWAKLNNKNR